MLMCQGDKGSFCNAGTLNETRCDLLGMSCDAKAQAVGWAPCVSKKAPEDFSTVNMPMKCEGPYLIWHINGTQYLDCTAEGYSGCTGTRCVL
jgi:hypothetical protein